MQGLLEWPRQSLSHHWPESLLEKLVLYGMCFNDDLSMCFVFVRLGSLGAQFICV